MRLRPLPPTRAWGGPSTVRNDLSEAIGEFGAGSRIEAARIARGKGWL